MLIQAAPGNWVYPLLKKNNDVAQFEVLSMQAAPVPVIGPLLKCPDSAEHKELLLMQTPPVPSSKYPGSQVTQFDKF